MSNTPVLLTTDLKDLKFKKRGKVRDIYELDNKLFIVATDRISCFDVVLPDGIPDKGKILTGLSLFWFKFTEGIIPNHLVNTDVSKLKDSAVLAGRSMIVKNAKPLPVECIVRGYLAGSGWKEYKEKGSVAGIKLESGLVESSKLPRPIFTPSTKAESGHDMNITGKDTADMIGKKLAKQVETKSIQIYQKASQFADSKGIIIADVKFEFGIFNDELILIDEVLTPDSSRFWPKSDYKPGGPVVSFDKQFVRDYLDSINWDRNPPAPHLPVDIIAKTSEKYREAFRRLTE